MDADSDTGLTTIKRRENPAGIDTPVQKTTLFLSFDDGPNKGSEWVNEEALTDSIPVTVFIIGKFVDKNDSTRLNFSQYAHNPQIEMGNHSYTHANGHYRAYYRNPEFVKEDFLSNNDSLQLTLKLARLPGRNCWRVAGRQRTDLDDAIGAADSLAANGYTVFGWDIEWRYDFSGRIVESSDLMFQKVQRMAQQGNSFFPGNIVILCHDPMLADEFNRRSLKDWVKKIRSDGRFRFERLSKYPQAVELQNR